MLTINAQEWVYVGQDLKKCNEEIIWNWSYVEMLVDLETYTIPFIDRVFTFSKMKIKYFEVNLIVSLKRAQ